VCGLTSGADRQRIEAFVRRGVRNRFTVLTAAELVCEIVTVMAISLKRSEQ